MLAEVILSSLVTLVSSSSNPRVGVIGGGFAGLGAAGELEKLGIDYVLLEAADRLGGRVWPIKHEGRTIQLGAEFINGQDNDIYRIANNLGLIDKKEYDYGMFVSNISYGLGGSPMDQKALEEWATFVEPLEDKFADLGTIFPEFSVGDVFNRSLKNFLEEHKEKKNFFEGMAKLYRSYYESEWSSPVDELALDNFQEWDDKSNEDSSWILKGDGFGAVLQKLEKNVNMSNVRLNAKVSTIDWSEDGAVNVFIGEGKEALKFDHVIVTVPLGYLKKTPKLFTPKLPKIKRQAIRTLGFGSLQKVFLEYEKPFWADDIQTLMTVRIKGLMPEGTALTDALRTFVVVDSQPNTLLLWLSGKGPDASANLSNKKLATIITQHLREAYNDTSIPEPKHIFTHNWDHDELVQGAYSYITPSSYETLDDSYGDMASPVMKSERPVICFAGEHTHKTLYQTTSGAYESGIREAQRIALFHKRV